MKFVHDEKMTENFDPRLKDGLRRIIKKSGQTVSSTAIINEFMKPQIGRSVLKTLNELVKRDSIALHLFESDVDTNATNLRTTTPRRWLECYLEKYVAQVCFIFAIISNKNKNKKKFQNNY